MRSPQPPTESSRLGASASNIAAAVLGLEPAQHEEVVAAMRAVLPGLLDVQASMIGGFVVLSFVEASATRSALRRRAAP